MRSVVLALLCACSQTPDASPPPRDAPSDVASDDALLPDAGLAPGSLTVTWIHGSPACGSNTDPELQQHAYNAATYIFRQNKCDTFEAPFIYLLVGETSALLLDTGDTNTPALRTAVRAIIGTKPLLVAHTHSHGDHVKGDPQFAGQANTTVVGTSLNEVRAAFGIDASSTAQKDLGGRVLDVFAIPGHQATHIAVYDRQTGLLLTGDTVYPGLLFISDWTAYRASIAKLQQFATTHPISFVLGAHVEMTSTPRQVYPYGTTYQPAEHVLQLTSTELAELANAVSTLGATPPAVDVPYDDFVLSPQ